MIHPTSLNATAPAVPGDGTQRVPVLTPMASPAFELVVPQNFPTELTAEQTQQLLQTVAIFDLEKVPAMSIATMGSESEKELNKVLDGFLARIDKQNAPGMFKLVEGLSDAIEAEKLEEVAENLLNAKPTVWERIIGALSAKKMKAAANRAYEEAARIASGKSKKLSDLLNSMEAKLNAEMASVTEELRVQEQLKEQYQLSFRHFAEDTVLLSSFVAKAQAHVAARAVELANRPQELAELQDKLQALESRALAVERLMSKLPADQLVVRQLQNAGVASLQEIGSTIGARFASIKMTLLTLHGARMVQDLQRLGQEGANLDANLARVRNSLMKDVVTTAANAPGNNRLADAQQLKAIVANSKELVTIVEAARLNNQAKFEQTRLMLADARKDMLTVGQVVQPGKALSL